MTAPTLPEETILLVDDEEAVRRTFRDWLTEARLEARILAAADAEAALVLANQHQIDLAILDWHLGAGDDGLQLLQDLYEFNPDVVAIMVTGYANQATPLDAMRMGVRDYLDKNQTLDRETFLTAVRKQLVAIRPVKRERLLRRELMAFRESVEKVLPLVQATAALNDPVPLPVAVGGLFRFVLQTTRAAAGMLLVRRYDERQKPAEVYRLYDHTGQPLEMPLVPFSRSLAANVVSRQEPCALARLDQAAGVELQPFEKGRISLLAAPLSVGPGFNVVLELFDKQGPSGPVPFTQEDRQFLSAAADFGAEMLRQALAHRQMHQVLLDAVGAALAASHSVTSTITTPQADQPAPPAVLDELKKGLSASTGGMLDADDSLRLAEAIRVLALRHGAPAVQHCVRLVESLRELLDKATNA